MAPNELTQVRFETEDGTVMLGIDGERAPLTAANFMAYVDGGFLNDATIYRIVTLANQAAGTVHPIEVIQFGSPAPGENRAPPLPPVPHEPTSQTGIAHLDGTLSLARNAPGSGGHGFFICIGPQPELDEGGGRNPDRAGFAAFGKVLSGAEVLRKLAGRAEPTEYMQSPLPIRITRLIR